MILALPATDGAVLVSDLKSTGHHARGLSMKAPGLGYRVCLHVREKERRSWT